MRSCNIVTAVRTGMIANGILARAYHLPRWSQEWITSSAYHMDWIFLVRCARRRPAAHEYRGTVRKFDVSQATI